jgi:hypothetical protein
VYFPVCFCALVCFFCVFLRARVFLLSVFARNSMTQHSMTRCSMTQRSMAQRSMTHCATSARVYPHPAGAVREQALSALDMRQETDNYISIYIV